MNKNVLNKRVEIQKSIVIQNELLQDVPDFTTFASTWASIECIGNGREQLKDGKEGATLKYEIVMRYREDIKRNMRIKHGDTIYKIEHVPYDYKGLKDELHLFCTVIEEGAYNG